MRYRASSLSLVIAALLVSLPAAGQGVGTDPAAAAALFREGRDAAKRGDYVTACSKLDDSYRLDPAVGTLLNLADCNEHIGKVTTAWQLFRQAADRLAAEDNRLPAAKTRIEALAPRIARLTIVLATDAPPETTVTRNTTLEVGRGSLGTVLPIDPGKHVIVVSAPGRLPRRYEVEVGEGQAESVTVEPGDVAPPTTPDHDPKGGPDTVGTPTPGAGGGLGTMRTTGIVVGGLGVVGLGVAIATGLMLPGKQETVDAHCDADKLCDAEGYEAAQSGETLSVVNTTMWFVGGIAAGAGVALIIAGGESGAPSTALRLGPLPGGGFASIGGRF
jgi:hypothetical protein